MNLTLRKNRATTPRSPLNGDLDRLRDEMGRTFDRFFAHPFGFTAIEPKAFRSEGWLPAIDVSETDDQITIRAEVPGIPAKDLDISVSRGILTIAGEKEESSETKEEGYCCCERRFGSFSRSIELPDTADADKIAAESDNGVVTIRIPKKPGAKPRQVEVKQALPAAKKVPVSA